MTAFGAGAQGDSDLERRCVFRCGSKHDPADPGADVTAVVEAELADIADVDRTPLLELRDDERRPPWSIAVTCGEGHENAFTSAMVEEAAKSSPAGSVVVTGRALTAEERYWQGVATEQAPAKQAERLGAAAGFVFANLAVLGTVVTGFGLLTDVSVDRSWWIWPFIGFGVLSLIASILAQLPWLGEAGSLGNLDELRPAHRRAIGRKAGLALASMILFAVAIVFGVTGLVLDGLREQADSEVSAQWTPKPDGGTLAISITADNLDDGARVRATATGLRTQTEAGSDDVAAPAGASDEERVTLYEGTVEANESGEVEISTSVEVFEGYESIEVTATLPADGGTETVELDTSDFGPASPDDGEGAKALADRYSPVLIMATGTACVGARHERDDPYDPEEVGIFAELTRLVRSPLADIVQSHPLESIDVLESFGDDSSLVLDIVGASPKSDEEGPATCLEYRRRYLQVADRYEPVTYATVEETSRGNVRLVYRFFYVYDDWWNKHEGDWEDVSLIFRSASCSFETIDELVRNACSPSLAVFARHGFRRPHTAWHKVRKRDGTHPVVFVGSGSHASYVKPGRKFLLRFTDWAPRDPLFPGEGGKAPLGREIRPNAILIDCEAPPAWWLFKGLWGEQHRKKGWSGPKLNLPCLVS